MPDQFATNRPLLLLVDDSPEIAFIVKRIAKKADQEIACCRTVAEAWIWLESCLGHLASNEQEGGAAGVPDLVLLDLHLPGPSGLELCSRLRESPPWEKVPIAILSDWHRSDEIAAALETGADYVLEKDLLCRPEEWQQRLGQILSFANGRDSESIIGLLQDCSLPGNPEEALATFQRALNRLATSRLGPEVIRVLLRKVLGQARANASEWNPVLLTSWLALDGLGFDTAKVPQSLSPALARVCWDALALKLVCVVGKDAPRLLREAVEPASPIS
ncbi:MAG: PleD family two-component system response regulator [Gemmataceae bacterium]